MDTHRSYDLGQDMSAQNLKPRQSHHFRCPHVQLSLDRECGDTNDPDDAWGRYESQGNHERKRAAEDRRNNQEHNDHWQRLHDVGGRHNDPVDSPTSVSGEEAQRDANDHESQNRFEAVQEGYLPSKQESAQYVSAQLICSKEMKTRRTGENREEVFRFRIVRRDQRGEGARDDQDRQICESDAREWPGQELPDNSARRRGGPPKQIPPHRTRTFGLKSPYAISTKRLTTMTIKVKYTATPSTTGRSWALTALTARLPRPGIANTFSTITVPPRTETSSTPRTLTTGSDAFFSACLITIDRSVSPDALNVRMNSPSSTLDIASRVCLITTAMGAAARAMTGNTNDFSHPTGDELHAVSPSAGNT